MTPETSVGNAFAGHGSGHPFLALLALAGLLAGLTGGCRQRDRPAERRPRPARAPDRVAVPATCFLRGSPAGPAPAHEQPQRRVCLSAFGIDRGKVTRRQYHTCVAAGRCSRAAYGTRPGHADPELPVVGVSWQDAAAYCRFTGGRLPTEAEWELAACGTDGRTYPWGSAAPTCDRVHFQGCAPAHLHRARERPGNVGPLGTEEMVGNAWEWIADAWAADAYASAPERDPRGPAQGEHRVIRGGSYVDSADYLRCRARYHWKPDARLVDVGFRCAHGAH
jgi:formylglycine-generating enzyme required for sulfatase activity